MLRISDVEPLTALDGLFTNGKVASGVSPTRLVAEWFNAVQTELVNVVEGAGLTIDPDNSAQVFAAIKIITLSLIPDAPVTSVNSKTGAVILGAGDVGAYPATGGQLDGSLDATGQITEAGQRVYSPNNPPTTASILQNGWVKDAATGLIRQWALVSSTDPKYVHLTLPIAFPNAVLNVQNTVLRTAAAGRGVDNWSSVYGATLSGVYVGTDEYGSYVEAIGY
ncbi:gp53-like domain-containing protein [Klebsiella quasipneumoniae]|uniref:gp53-like domain-containing protein n=1 Tax=Klebsiella quasipneumoniae TaxID=1463165 RepID=UPI00149608EE|nr:hypothetical protein [Klebsiella quasipneumoniae]